MNDDLGWWFDADEEKAEDEFFEREARFMQETMEDDALTPTEFVKEVNECLKYDCGEATIKGEVASFKINQGKWVFFDLKDEKTSVNCFMPVWDLRTELEDGMTVVVNGTPGVTKWGRFSVTVKQIMPVGEGSLKKAYELLKKKLTLEGLFAPEKKRKIPADLSKIGVISSKQAAGFADFVKILNERWGGLKVQVAHTQVQGLDAPDQIVRALNYFNQRGEVEMIAILRGGGSADDLACFNDEKLVRAVAMSKIPVICGIGHEVDESLCDLACDVRASTPSNAAEKLTPRDRASEMARVRRAVEGATRELLGEITSEAESVSARMQKLGREMVTKINAICEDKMVRITAVMKEKLARVSSEIEGKMKLLEALNPEKVLKRGYAILSGKISPGNVVKITTFEAEIDAEVKKVKERN